MDAGPEAMTDATEIAQVRRQARKVHVKSLALATTLVALALMIPALEVMG